MVEFLAGLAGLGVLLSACVNIGKTVNLIKDGQGGKIVNIINTLVFLLFIALPIFGVNLDWVGIDIRLGDFGEVLQALSGFLVLIGSSSLFHKAARGTPLIGKSFSYDRENA